MLSSCCTAKIQSNDVWMTKYEMRLNGMSKEEIEIIIYRDKQYWSRNNRTSRLNIRKDCFEYNISKLK
jgi:hypothetical protein